MRPMARQQSEENSIRESRESSRMVLSLRGAVFATKQSPTSMRKIASHKPLAMTFAKIRVIRGPISTEYARDSNDYTPRGDIVRAKVWHDSGVSRERSADFALGDHRQVVRVLAHYFSARLAGPAAIFNPGANSTDKYDTAFGA